MDGKGMIDALLSELPLSQTRDVRVLRLEGDAGVEVLLTADDAARIMGIARADQLLSVLTADQQRVVDGRVYVDDRGFLRGLARLVLADGPLRQARKRAVEDGGGERTRYGRRKGEDVTLYVAMDPSNSRIENIYDSLEGMVTDGHFDSVEEAELGLARDPSGMGRFVRWQDCPRTLKEHFFSCGGSVPLGRPRGTRPWKQVDQLEDGRLVRRYRSMSAAALSVDGDCAGLKDAISSGGEWMGSTWRFVPRVTES